MNFFKKIFFILSIFLILKTALLADTFFSKNKTYSGEITILGKKIELLEGDWRLSNKYEWNVVGITGKGFGLVQTEGNNIKSHISIWTINTRGKKSGLVGTILYKERINNNHDGCSDKSEYYFAKLWQEGASANWLKVRHIDLSKETNSPDYNVEAQGYIEPYYEASFKNFVKKNNLKVPKILISQIHMFYSPTLAGKGMVIYIDRNPEFYGVGKTLNGDESSSEYHKNNLSKFPKKEKLVKKIIQGAFTFHSELEEKFKFKKHQRLNLSPVSKIKIKKDSSTLANQLEKINQLYKSGALTKKEFEAAKQKLLK